MVIRMEMLHAFLQNTLTFLSLFDMRAIDEKENKHFFRFLLLPQVFKSIFLMLTLTLVCEISYE